MVVQEMIQHVVICIAEFMIALVVGRKDSAAGGCRLVTRVWWSCLWKRADMNARAVMS